MLHARRISIWHMGTVRVVYLHAGVHSPPPRPGKMLPYHTFVRRGWPSLCLRSTTSWPSWDSCGDGPAGDTSCDTLSAEFSAVTSHDEREREGGHDGISVAF